MCLYRLDGCFIVENRNGGEDELLTVPAINGTATVDITAGENKDGAV